MSLISFHRLLISAAIGFCVVVTVWEVRHWMGDGGAGAMLLAISFAVLALGLALYLKRLNRILGYERDQD